MLHLLFSVSLRAQLDDKEKSATITALKAILHKKYVFPEVAASMSATLDTRIKDGSFDTISTRKEFAFQLTRLLQEVSRDQHLSIAFSPRDTSTRRQRGSAAEWELQLMKENNYGIREKKILPGNIGYLDLPLFGPMSLCRDSITAAMRAIANTDALIIDLRSCRGSLDENTIPFFHSFLFRDSVHITDFYTRENDSTVAYWTSPSAAPIRYLRPIYVVTSGRTFSGGEAFAYELQQLKRAKIIGEKTRGGANPTELERINDNFTVSVPYARSINAVSKTNWEGTGVSPDTVVTSNVAVYTAQLLATTNLAASATGKNKKILAILADSLRSNKPVFVKTTFRLRGYENAREVTVAGSFNSFARKTFVLKKINGEWIGETDVPPGEIVYSFIVDGRWIADPAVPGKKLVNGLENSYRIVAAEVRR